MKPISEDHVLSLLRGVEDREKAALKRQAKATSEQSPDPVSTGSARLFRFPRTLSQTLSAHMSRGDIVQMDAARKARAARKTTQGRFFYAVAASRRGQEDGAS